MKCPRCSRIMKKGTLVMDTGQKLKVWFCWCCDHMERRMLTRYETEANQKLDNKRGGDKSGS